ncbi:hypothetical protein M422DRAFT_267643 [Sphaerobolus stellatus SS14]|uniref:HMG box domain-containing protein n=1 Tax=Sphaerobolus stellatus (strain SS14) TaxID=990650 RepID=A0A0C9TLP1_SPHS4|nr:hypothetical protein M422DRAFT_267643 [Sphaerobolus stellatus SS14]
MARVSTHSRASSRPTSFLCPTTGFNTPAVKVQRFPPPPAVLKAKGVTINLKKYARHFLSMKKGKISRPLNPWVLFRADEHAAELKNLLKGQKMKPQRELSGVFATRWRELSDEKRSEYKEISRQLKIVHELVLPGWVYKPQTQEQKRRRKQEEEDAKEIEVEKRRTRRCEERGTQAQVTARKQQTLHSIEPDVLAADLIADVHGHAEDGVIDPSEPTLSSPLTSFPELSNEDVDMDESDSQSLKDLDLPPPLVAWAPRYTVARILPLGIPLDPELFNNLPFDPYDNPALTTPVPFYIADGHFNGEHQDFTIQPRLYQDELLDVFPIWGE